MLAYANNYDMIRIQACHDIWSLDPRAIPGEGTPSTPLRVFKFDHSLELGNCFPSSELIFTGAAVGLIKSGLLYAENEPFSILTFGVVRGAALSMLAVLVMVLCFHKRQVVAALVHAIVFLTVITDPANLLYVNTFYTEFSALFFLYASIVILYLSNIQDEGLIFPLLLGISLLGLGLSKPQHMLLPFGVWIGLLVGNIHHLRSRKKIVLICLIAAVSTVFLQARNLGHERSTIQRYANSTDLILGAMLPASSDPELAAEMLGLPGSCAHTGLQNWYGLEPGVPHPCPEVRSVSRIRILLLLLREPGVLLHMTNEGIMRLQPWIVRLGQVEGQHFGDVGHYSFTISSWIDSLSIYVVRFFFVLPMAVLIVDLWISLRNRPGRSVHFLASEISMIMTLYLVFYSALLGDGYVDFSKHTHLWFSIFLALSIILSIKFTSFLAAAIKKDSALQSGYKG